MAVVIHFAEGVEYSGLIEGLDFGPRNLMEPVMQGGDARTWYRSGYRLWDPVRRGIVYIFLTLCSPLLWAKHADDPCRTDLKVGSWCRLAINELHPTQPGVGLLQVQTEAKALKHKSAKKLWALAEKKRIPVVIGPDGQIGRAHV